MAKVAVTGLLFGIPVFADQITGTVIDQETGSPISGISVQVEFLSGSLWLVEEETQTGVDGSYSVPLLPGSYLVRFFDASGLYASAYYDHAAERTWAKMVHVATGVGATGINASLGRGGRIEGRTRLWGTQLPLPGCRVILHRWDEIWWTAFAETHSGPNGYYRFAGLPAGSYRVEFQDPSEQFIDLVYPHSYHLLLGKTLEVGPGEAVTDIEVGMVRGGAVTGFALAPGEATPLEGIRVSAYKLTLDEWEWMGDGVTAADGAYLIDNLPFSGYRLRFEDTNRTYLTTYHIAADSLAESKDVVAVPGLTQRWKSVAMKLPSTVSGQVAALDGVSPMPGIRATAYQWDGEDWVEAGSGISESDGTYQVGGLRQGLYVLSFEDPLGRYQSQAWPGQAGFTQGDPVRIGPGASLTGYHATLAPARSIGGTVTALDPGLPLSGITVLVYGESGDGWVPRAWGQTDSLGAYVVAGLSAGVYRVEYVDWAGDWVGEWYDQASAVEDGTDIDLRSEESAWGVDAALPGTSSFSGRVAASDGRSPLPNVRVVAYQLGETGWDVVAETQTDDAGRYRVGGLAAGIYRVVFVDETGTHLSEAYGDAAEVESGADILVPLETDVAGINNVLPLPSSISGRVTDNPIVGGWLAGVKVHLINLTTGESREDTTSLFGQFKMERLRAGSYQLYTEVPEGSVYLDEWYDGVLHSPQGGEPSGIATVQVPESGSVDGLRFSLPRGGEFTGRVTALGGNPLPGAMVTVMGSLASYVGLTDSNGVYRIPGVYPDDCQVKVAYPGLADQWSGGADHRDQAVTVQTQPEQVIPSDFDLRAGQSPARVYVESSPPGAAVVLDGLPVGLTTPALIDLGEVASANEDLLGIAPHVLTVTLAGYQRPAPQWAHGVEAETRNLFFDLDPATPMGEVEIATTPPGAAVYVDLADTPVGSSPLTVSDLAPGVHTVWVEKTGHLLPRPVEVEVVAGAPVQVHLPLSSTPSANAFTLEIQTAPPRADLFLNSLSSDAVTDAIVNTFDPAHYGGAGWTTTTHRVVMRKSGYRTPAPRWVDAKAGESRLVGVVLMPDRAAMTDVDQDGLPDEWQRAYRMWEQAPGFSGPVDDPDLDGAPNESEMHAGTHPLDPTSVLMSRLELIPTPEGLTLQLTFLSVPGQRYVVQSAAALDDENSWNVITWNVVARDSLSIAIGLLPTTGPGFAYRVIPLCP